MGTRLFASASSSFRSFGWPPIPSLTVSVSFALTLRRRHIFPGLKRTYFNHSHIFHIHSSSKGNYSGTLFVVSIACMTDSWSFELGISLKRILLQGMDKEKFGRRHGGYPAETSPSRHGEDLSPVDLFTRYVPGGSRSKVEVRYKVEIAANRTRIWLENGVVRCLRAPRMRAIGACVTILVAGGVMAPFNTFHSPLTCSPSIGLPSLLNDHSIPPSAPPEL